MSRRCLARSRQRLDRSCLLVDLYEFIARTFGAGSDFGQFAGQFGIAPRELEHDRVLALGLEFGKRRFLARLLCCGLTLFIDEAL